MIGQSHHPLGLRELVRLAGLHPGQQTAVKRLLRDLVRSGAVKKDGKRFELSQAKSAKGAKAAIVAKPERPGRFRTPDAPAEIVEGILSVHPDGFGFVQDVFLPPPEVAKVLDGDRVRIRKTPSGRGRFEGRVLEVLERRREQSVGIYHEETDGAFVQPQDSALPPIRVPRTQIARPGDVVKVRLGAGTELLGKTGLVGEVSGSLGRPGDPSQEVLSVVFGQGFSDEFPAAAMDQADAIPLKVDVDAALAEGRRDLRKLRLVTIDGADARDFDDAVCAEDTPDGWRLWVAIADVSHYVRPGTPLDREALARGTSVYLPDRVLPMLPERLSNGICSLKPDEDRLCWVAEMVIDRAGETQQTQIYAGLMRSHARCTYEEVHAVLEGKSVPGRDAFQPDFQRLQALARTLNRMRSERGALDFDLPEHKVIVGSDGMPERIERRERLESHRLIEACMLAANEAVARFFHERALPTVYRFHAKPDPEKLATFTGLAEAYGFHVSGDEVDSRALNQFMRTLAGHPEQRALNQLLLRSMMQATYSAENVGHYGLAAEHYLHFTSPIRRYPDLMVHRLLQSAGKGGKRGGGPDKERELESLERTAVHCSERERAAVQAEREIVSFYAAVLMKDRVGEEIDGTVSSLADFGVFIELADPVVEGLVKSTRLGPGARLDVRRHALVFPTGLSLRVGQPMRVRVVSVSLERRQIELEPVQVAPEARSATRGAGREVVLQSSGRRNAGSETRSSRPARRERPERPPARPPPTPSLPPRSKQEESVEDPSARRSSPYPGFDRLRALAARSGKPGAGRGEGSGRSEGTRESGSRSRGFGPKKFGKSGGKSGRPGSGGGKNRRR